MFRRARALVRALAQRTTLADLVALVDAVDAARDRWFGVEVPAKTPAEVVRAMADLLDTLAEQRDAQEARAMRAEEAAAEAIGEQHRAAGRVVTLRPDIRSPRAADVVSDETPDLFDAPHPPHRGAAEEERRRRSAKRATVEPAALPLVVSAEKAERRAERRQTRKAEVAAALEGECSICRAERGQKCREITDWQKTRPPHGERIAAARMRALEADEAAPRMLLEREVAPVFAVACERCGAHADFPCVRPDGLPFIKQAHAVRLRAAGLSSESYAQKSARGTAPRPSGYAAPVAAEGSGESLHRFGVAE